MSEKIKEYAIYPGQIKINNEIFFGLDYKLTDFYNELAEENKQLKCQLQQKENIIKEVREYCNLNLKIAKEVIIESEKWLEVEEQAEFAKKDIHTAKVVKRNLGDILEILDKEVN